MFNGDYFFPVLKCVLLLAAVSNADCIAVFWREIFLRILYYLIVKTSNLTFNYSIHNSFLGKIICTSSCGLSNNPSPITSYITKYIREKPFQVENKESLV